MVRKETCPDCKGNRYVRIQRNNGDSIHRKCPSCDGNGYRIRVSLDR
jgi:DnaJ-class molecular chaperone